MHNKWKETYLKAKEYQNRHGHLIVLKGDKDNLLIKKWAKEQIKLKRSNSLTQEQLSLLSDIFFDFQTAGKQWEKWEKEFYTLKKIYESTGNSNVSQLKKGTGPWVSAQRVKFRQNELSQTKIALLESINITWNPVEKVEEQWISQFTRLKEFYDKNGHSNIGRGSDSNLGTWSSAQRTAYRKKIISQKRIKMLESIDFKWKLR